MHLSVRSALPLVILLLSACSTFQVTINQGNAVKNERLAQLTPGMTPVQVEYLLGTPLLRSELAPNRWDYVMQVRRGGETLQERRVTVFFADGVVARVEDTNPPAAAADAEATDAEAAAAS